MHGSICFALYNLHTSSTSHLVLRQLFAHQLLVWDNLDETNLRTFHIESFLLHLCIYCHSGNICLWNYDCICFSRSSHLYRCSKDSPLQISYFRNHIKSSFFDKVQWIHDHRGNDECIQDILQLAKWIFLYLLENAPLLALHKSSKQTILRWNSLLNMNIHLLSLTLKAF